MTKDMRAKVDAMPEDVALAVVQADDWVDESGRLLRTELDWRTEQTGAWRP
ncbi:hypothetical protein [Streptomyces sp. NPDC005780]|uniref:hypothetical protein n=1 Tax=Streptomyces sp. NPDC005780 TaxID=3364730 RepID=UPI00369EFADD